MSPWKVAAVEKAVSNLNLEQQIPKEALEGNRQVTTDAGVVWNMSKGSMALPSVVSVR